MRNNGSLLAAIFWHGGTRVGLLWQPTTAWTFSEQACIPSNEKQVVLIVDISVSVSDEKEAFAKHSGKIDGYLNCKNKDQTFYPLLMEEDAQLKRATLGNKFKPKHIF